MTKDQFFQGFINLSADEKLEQAKNAGDLLRKAFNDDKAWLAFMRGTASFFAAADNVVQAEEVIVYNYATGDNMSYQDFFNMTQNLASNGEFVNKYWEYVNSLNDNLRLVICYYVCALAGLDEKFTKEEAGIIAALLPDISAL